MTHAMIVGHVVVILTTLVVIHLFTFFEIVADRALQREHVLTIASQWFDSEDEGKDREWAGIVAKEIKRWN